jgi:hypothetical protein
MLADRRLGVVETKVPLVIFFCKASADPCPRHPSAGAHGIPDPTGDGVGGILNMRVKPFDNVQARRAVEGFGLGRAEIAKVIFQGRTQPLVSIFGARGDGRHRSQ